MNLYISTSIPWDKIGMTVDGLAPEVSQVTIEGEDYYKVSTRISQVRIDGAVNIGFVFSARGEDVAVTRALSVMEYVQIAKSGAAADSRDYALLDAILNYAEAVYAYTHEDTADYEVEGSYGAPVYDDVSEALSGIESYSIDLGESLRWVFVASDYNSRFTFTYTLNGQTVTNRVCSPDKNRQIVISVKARDMLESIYITNESGDTVEVNLATYYNDVKELSVGEDLTQAQKDEALAVVDSIYHYAAAARTEE